MTPADVKKLKVDQLRAALDERGLDTSGLKAALVARLTDAVEAAATLASVAASEPPAPELGAPPAAPAPTSSKRKRGGVSEPEPETMPAAPVPAASKRKLSPTAEPAPASAKETAPASAKETEPVTAHASAPASTPALAPAPTPGPAPAPAPTPAPAASKRKRGAASEPEDASAPPKRAAAHGPVPPPAAPTPAAPPSRDPKPVDGQGMSVEQWCEIEDRHSEILGIGAWVCYFAEESAAQ